MDDPLSQNDKIYFIFKSMKKANWQAICLIVMNILCFFPLGNAILVKPVTDARATGINIYFPGPGEVR